MFTGAEAQPNGANVALFGYGSWQLGYLAQTLYGMSATDPLTKINCASILRELFESEFFGHVRSSFTGAGRDCVVREFAASRHGLCDAGSPRAHTRSDSDLADVGAWPRQRQTRQTMARRDDIPKTDPS